MIARALSVTATAIKSTQGVNSSTMLVTATNCDVVTIEREDEQTGDKLTAEVRREAGAWIAEESREVAGEKKIISQGKYWLWNL